MPNRKRVPVHPTIRLINTPPASQYSQHSLPPTVRPAERLSLSKPRLEGPLATTAPHLLPKALQ
ncbi:hypothetical protein SPHINGO8AM_160191 [Sphingomonas sp. 8AM]|nr:hypothetical protein SPHINGO8AM_160191 [Sphingomonas sp. 8AM]